MNKKLALKIYEGLDQMFPDAKCELNYSNNFELLVAVMLSSQTTDNSVNKLTKTLFTKYPTPQSFIDIPLKELENDLRGIGLFRNKAKYLKEMSEKLINEHNSEVPQNLEKLSSLPGVGRKTSNVVLIEAFKIPSIPVDTHVERVSKRLGFAKKNDSVLEVEKQLAKYYDKKYWCKLHHLFIFFGRYHCHAQNPKCNVCDYIEICRKKACN